MSTAKKTRCHNCKHASTPFKLGKVTHYQCLHHKHDLALEKGFLSAWDTLQEFWNTCKDHELNTKPTEGN